MKRNRSFFTLSGAHGDAQGPVWGGTLPGALPRGLAHAPSEWDLLLGVPSVCEPLQVRGDGVSVPG